MATGNEILSYTGDSALAASGGLGKQGTQQVISGVWHMVDGIESAMQQMRALNFQRSQQEYDKKLKDRDQVIELIKSGELQTDEIDDSDRLRINSNLNKFTEDFKKYVRENGSLSDEEYIELNQRYKDISSQIAISKANRLAIQADIKANNMPFDSNYGTVRTSKQIKNQDGSVSTITEEHGSSNPRTFDYNQNAFKEHMAIQRAKINENPSHKYEPFVPIEKYDYDQIMGGPVFEESSTENGYKKTIKYTPSFEKTASKFVGMYQNPETRKQLQTAYNDITTGGVETSTIIDEANKRLIELYPNDQTLRITRGTTIPLFFTLLNMSRQKELTPKSREEFIDKNSEALALKQAESKLELIAKRKEAEIEVDTYERKKKIDNKYQTEIGMSDDTRREIFKQRSELINDPTNGYSAEQRTQALIDLQTELWGTETEIKNRQKAIESDGNPKAISPKGAMGTFQIMPNTAESIEKEDEFQSILKKANLPVHRTLKKRLQDPQYNELLRDYYYKKLQNIFDYDTEKVLAAYNAGPTRVLRAVKKWGDDWVNHIPSETKQYLEKMTDPNPPSKQSTKKKFPTY